jgi:hypothetical protein
VALFGATMMLYAGCASSGGPADRPAADTTAADTTPADTTPADTTPADTTPADTTPADTVGALDLLAGSPSPYATGADRWEVWVCSIPADTTSPQFADDPWRLDATPAQLASVIDDGVAQWWSVRSHGIYRPVVKDGATVAVGADAGDQACVDAAVRGASPESHGVFVVATAAHRPDVPGGWGRPGTCSSPCAHTPVTASGRAVYVGAGDFHPSWGDRPPLDLLQHEMGHALDLPHSATTRIGDTVRYESALDVMSDSAAPRALDPDRRDAADTLGANRVGLGWLPLADVVVVRRRTDASEQQVILSPSTSPDPGPRLAVVPLDATRLLTVELRSPVGPDAHLDEPGVSVHLVDQSPRPGDTGCTAAACTGQHRVQRPLWGTSPFLELLTAGEEIEVEGWRIRVVEVSSTTSRVALTPV